ncbi:MAG TPA: DUF763 domain-containing protein, partial [Candidatus Paceibacterota bacterium]|nr:DUF763 domain-containing protein [Candidatus Paceibacterota bacterium]
MKRGIATFTLDYGKCPPWLFERMVKLGREMTRVIVEEYGPDEFVARLGDPVWFQSLGTVLAFDWNASGLTTILTAAIKEALRGRERDFGIFLCGGKGKTSRKTPDEIWDWSERIALPDKQASNLVHNSKMSAKVDSALVQDGFDIYHHAFVFSHNPGLKRRVASPGEAGASSERSERSERGRKGASVVEAPSEISWTVIQQGMNTAQGRARRYHWSSEKTSDLIVEPHSGISSPGSNANPISLNMTAREIDQNRGLAVELVDAGYPAVMKEIEILRKHSSELGKMIALKKAGQQEFVFMDLPGREFKYHPVVKEDFAKSKYLEKVLQALVDAKPKSYEDLVAVKGV